MENIILIGFMGCGKTTVGKKLASMSGRKFLDMDDEIVRRAGMKYIANLKITKARQEEALLTFRQSLLDAGAEVNDALVQWQTARGRLRLSKQQVASLQSAVRSSELLMRHSSQNYLEVLTARQTLLQAELSVASNRFDEIQGVINLYHALGGGASL